MIDRSQVMQILLDACPSYAGRFARYVEENYGQGEERLLYCELGDFAHHLCDLLAQKRTAEFANVFAVVEALHVDGDAFVKEAATIGLLEGIQNVSSHRDDIHAEQFVPFLKPKSAWWWNELNDFWQGKTKFVGERLQKPSEGVSPPAKNV